MATSRHGNTFTDYFYWTGDNYGNVISRGLNVPKDGWIVRMGWHMGGYGGTVRTKLCIWDGNGNLEWQSPARTYGNGRAWREDTMVLRANRNADVWLGFYTHPNDARAFSTDHGPGDHVKVSSYTSWGGAPNIGGYDRYSPDIGTSYFDLVENATPVMTGFRGSTPAQNSTGNEVRPTFSGHLDHPNADRDYDWTDGFQLRVWREDTGEFLYNQIVQPSSAELSDGYFTRSPITVRPGVWLRADFRHRDTFGVWSAFSDERRFMANSGPNVPTSLIPASGTKLNALPFTLGATYSHPDGIARKDAQIRILNESGAILLKDSLWALGTWSGSNFTIASNHAAFEGYVLDFGTKYQYQIRFRDNSNVIGPYSAKIPITVNAKPNIPTNMVPTGGKATASNVLALTAVDPNADNITGVRLELFDKTNNVMVAGYPKVVAQNVASGSTISHVASEMVFGRQYRWRAQITDGLQPGYGDYSAWQDFVYDQVPTVVALSPDSEPNVNLVSQPSAEYDPAIVGAYWTDVNSTGQISRLSDEDTAWGEWCWRAATQVSPVAIWRAAKEPVDRTKPLWVTVEAKREVDSVEPSWILRLRARSSSNADLGILNVATGVSMPTAWTPLGGGLAANALPVNTTHVEVEFLPSNGVAAFVRFDSFSLKKIGSVRPNVHGYFDGDTAAPIPPSDYSWEGVVGGSHSVGRNIVDKLAVTLDISYTSNAAKKDDRVVLEQWDGTKWNALSDSGWVASARTAIPLDTSKLRNYNRYRVLVQARNTNNLIGETDWAIFDVVLDGPPELNITNISGNPDDASVEMDFEPSGISSSTFVAIEVAREPAGGGIRTTLAVMRDQSITHFVDHAPVNGEQYIYMVRQIQTIGSDNVASRWSESPAMADYRHWHLKNLEDPDSANLAFDVQQEDEPDFARHIDKSKFRAWGNERFTHLTGRERSKGGGVKVKIQSHKPTTRDDMAKLEAFFEYGGGYILLCPRPARRLYVSVEDFNEVAGATQWESEWDIKWEETHYVEDEYLSGRADA